jgi:hypothetical protein
MLQEYLRADPTVSERCSGATQADKSGASKNFRSHKAKKQVENFDKVWAGSQEYAKWAQWPEYPRKRQAIIQGSFTRCLSD